MKQRSGPLDGARGSCLPYTALWEPVEVGAGMDMAKDPGALGR